VFKLVKDRSKACEQAIQLYQAGPQRVTMISDALIADVACTIQWNRDVSADVKADLTKEIAATLGIGASSSGTNSFHAEQLIWGIRDDERFMKITAKNLPSTGSSGIPHRIIPHDSPAEVLR